MTSPSSGFQTAVMEMPTGAMSSSKLMELPYDILLNIFSKLPARSVLQFRCVSKSSRHLVDDPALAAMHIAATNEHIDVEVRVFPFDYKYLLQFASCGLLGFKYYYGVHGTVGLYNPLRREYLRFTEPEERYDIEWERYGMGFDSVTNTHKIVHFSSHAYPDGSAGMVARVHVLGTGSWRRIPSVPPCGFNSWQNAYAYGNMHWIANPERIISFDFGEEKFRWTYPPRLTFLYGSDGLSLINLRGSLALIHLSDSKKKVEIWVHKEQKYWTKDYSMPLDDCSVGYSQCTVGAWEHGIYIKMFADAISKSLPYPSVVYYDLRCENKRQYCRYEELIDLCSYTGSLISLKEYDNLRTKSKKEKMFFDSADSEFPRFLSALLKAPRVK